jgi:hypothetical protein
MLGRKPAFTNVQGLFFDEDYGHVSMMASYGNVVVYGQLLPTIVRLDEFETICKKYAQSYHETFKPASLTYVFIFKAHTGD